MQTWMKTTLVASMLAAGSLSAGAVLAHEDKGSDNTPRGEARDHKVSAEEAHERMAKNHTQRLEKLEQALNLTEDQRDDWEDFKEALAERHERAGKRMSERTKTGKPQTAIEGLKMMEERAERMQEEAEEIRDAVEDFYPELSAEQQQVFDREFTQFKDESRKHHRKGGDSERSTAPQNN